MDSDKKKPSLNTPVMTPADLPAAASAVAPTLAPVARPEQFPPERNGPKGPEPTRYGDWEQNGRCTDF